MFTMYDGPERFHSYRRFHSHKSPNRAANEVLNETSGVDEVNETSFF